jgi:hypothetical protein
MGAKPFSSYCFQNKHLRPPDALGRPGLSPFGHAQPRSPVRGIGAGAPVPPRGERSRDPVLAAGAGTSPYFRGHWDATLDPGAGGRPDFVDLGRRTFTTDQGAQAEVTLTAGAMRPR